MISPQKLTKSTHLRERFRVWRLCLALMMVLTNLMPFSGALAASNQVSSEAPVALTNHLSLTVVSARTEPDFPNMLGGIAKGEPISEYQYLINIDNTGDPAQPRNTGCESTDANYPDSCDWPSLRAIPGNAPIYTQGDQSDFANGGGLDLPDGKYLISVLAEGFKLDGKHFTVPMAGPLEVALQPHPLPPATMRVQVFEDISPVNGAFDAPAEHGLPGFRVIINDVLGQISVDVFGNPLCTTYDAMGEPNGRTNCLVSDNNGDIIVPNLGPNRYDVAVVPPDGTDWTETTTLEGSLAWDTWLQEGGTGLDNEFVVAGEPFPWTVFGFVKPTNTLASGPTGGVKGKIVQASVYLPQTGGAPWVGDIWSGFSGARVGGPIEDAWVALSDLQNGDTAVYVGKANADGTFQINNIPNGNYQVTWWDTNLNYLLDWLQVTVSNGQIADMGTPYLTGWFTKVEGDVFNDLNQNGKREPGEPGLSGYTIVLRDRDNSEIDRGSIAVTTDSYGHYVMEKAYPIGSWMILEAYNDRYYTTGVTYQVENQPTETTVVGQGVDVGLLPILGQGGRLDWGVHPYDPTGTQPAVLQNGGIVGTVSYETTRNETDPRYMAVEGWQPGIPYMTVNLYSPVFCGTTSAPCDADGYYELAPDGSYAKGQLLNSVETEHWEQPTDCIARGPTGLPLANPQDQQLLPPDPTGKRCIEAPLMGTQFQSGFASLDGNYGFGDGCFGEDGFDVDTGTCFNGEDPTLLPSDDYLVEVVSPLDARGLPMYRVVKEEDINVFNGDSFAVPAVPPPACVGALHTVDVAGIGTDGPDAVINPSFVDAGGSPYEGQQKPLCDVKLVTLANGKSIAPLFDFFTDVPLPGRWKGYIIDDLTISTDPKSLNFGEKAGLSHMPIGIYDFTNRLITTIQSDPNGVYEVLLPSTYSINCPTPSGVCPNVYYMLGNDPGQPGALNTNYNPQYRTIGASFELWPGLITPSDLAPTKIVPGVLAAGTLYGSAPQCQLDAATPQLFAVAKPYVTNNDRTVSIQGVGFGASAGSVTLDGAAITINGWNDRQIAASVPTSIQPGVHQLQITAANGKSTINGLSFHVTGNSVPPFPSAGVLDTFGGSGLTLGNNWGVDGLLFGRTSGQAFVRTGNNVRTAWKTGNSNSFGTDQEAYFSFTQISTQSGVNEQGLLLKFDGGILPSSNGSHWIEVALNNSPANTIRIRTKSSGSGTITDRATINASFTNGDQLGARALSDGTVIVYKNGTAIGQTTIAATASWSGQIGVRFEGVGNVLSSNGEVRFDNFGGGSVVSTGYSPTFFEVGPGKSYSTVQAGVTAASNANGNQNKVVVVYPDTPVQWNPQGAYFENVVMWNPIALQGVGPGGVYPDKTPVLGSAIDGRGVAGDTTYADDWRTLVLGLNWSGVQSVYEGAVVTVLANDNDFQASRNPMIDGLRIQGGDQQGFPNNLNAIDPTIKDIAAIQGGGVYVNGYARYLHITNNVMESNGGAYGGAIRLGTPHLTGQLSSSQNTNIRIGNNRILANGGTNLAGAVGVFSGADNYEIDHNDICGNFSAEYGGGISHYGLSRNGSIHHNRIYFNAAYDEAGGIMIAGELPTNPSQLSPGAGPVNIYNNLIQNNLSNDDGGGLRFLMAGGPGTGQNRVTFIYNVYNNIIVNNVSTHEGGGVALNDTPDVRFFNNTVVGNITTATAMTSNGVPQPAGFSTSRNSTLLQNTLLGGAPVFSNPLLFNNLFWDNRAGNFTGNNVAGIGLAGDPNPIRHWDMGVGDGSGTLAPTNTLMQVTTGTTASPTNIVNTDPQIVQAYNTSVSIQPWRGLPHVIDILMVTVDATPNLLGNYHINNNSPAQNTGAASKSSINAPSDDIDSAPRPQNGGFDIGADEIGNTANQFPMSNLIETFSQPNGPLTGDWTQATTNPTYNVVDQNLVANSTSTTKGYLWWTQSAFGADQEAHLTFASVGTSTQRSTNWQGLLLKLNGTHPGAADASAIVVRYADTMGIQVRTKLPGVGWVTQAKFSATFTNGDQMGVQAMANGSVNVFKNGQLVGTVNVTTGKRPWSTQLAQSGGYIGLFYNFIGGQADNFGGGATMALPMVNTAAAEALGELADDEAVVEEATDEEDAVEGGTGSSIFLPLVIR